MSNYIYLNGELYHYGVKGMKWGVRRYQNKDGSLTNAGKRRYSKELYRQIESSGRQGKSWYAISDDLSKNAQFKSMISGMTELRKAHKEFMELSAKRDAAYDKQTRSISKKQMEKMVAKDIEKNREYYQAWKPRFFNKDGSPTEELKFYVQDAIESEHASKNQQFKELDDAYNRAWKNYDRLRNKAVNDLIGRHAHDSVITGNTTSSVRQIVEMAISSADIQLALDEFNRQ